MNRATDPHGGSITYRYSFVYFDQANPSNFFTAVTGKSSSSGGNWSFRHTPGSLNNYDTTIVNTPAGTITYRHIGPNYSNSGALWMVGLLMSKQIDTQTETYLWDKQQISSENYIRPGATGPTPVINPTGNQTGVAFTGGSGGANGQVSTMRIMNPTSPRGNSPGYPNGYIKYENSASPRPQGVDPYTGKTLPNSQSHFPID